MQKLRSNPIKKRKELDRKKVLYQENKMEREQQKKEMHANEKLAK